MIDYLNKEKVTGHRNELLMQNLLQEKLENEGKKLYCDFAALG